MPHCLYPIFAVIVILVKTLSAMWTLILYLGIATMIALWVIAIFDISTSDLERSSDKTLLLILVLFFPIVGTLIYFLLRKNFKTKPRAFDPGFHH